MEKETVYTDWSIRRFPIEKIPIYKKKNSIFLNFRVRFVKFIFLEIYNEKIHSRTTSNSSSLF